MPQAYTNDSDGITNADLAVALQRKQTEDRLNLAWSFLKVSFITLSAVALSEAVVSFLHAGTPFNDNPRALVTGGAIGAMYVSMKMVADSFRRTPRDIPEAFLAELHAKATDVAAHRNGKGLWIVRDPSETAPKVMTEGEFAKYEKLLASQGRALDRLRIDGDKLTLCRYVGGKLHAADGEPALVKIDWKTGKGTSAFFNDGQKSCMSPEEAKLPFATSLAT